MTAVPPLRIPAALDPLGEVTRFVAELTAGSGLGQDEAYRLRLAVEEIVVNVVEHGYRHDPAGVIELTAGRPERGACVLVEDRAPPFDPSRHARPPNLDLPPRERPLGGLGLFVATSMLDELRYERAGDRNRTWLVVRPREEGTG